LPLLVLRRPPEARRHEVVFSAEGYDVRGVPGRVTARAGMVLADGEDRNPPYLALLRLSSGERPTDAFVPGADNRVTARAFDVAGDETLGPVASAAFYYRRWGGEEWTPLPTTRQDARAEARWPGGLAPGFYDLRLRLEDSAGNALDLTAEPALRFGTAEGNTPPAPFALRAPGDGAALDPGVQTTFAWDAAVDPDGDPLTYRLRLSGPGLDTTFAAGTATTHTVDLAGRVDAGHSYAWHVEASDGFSVTPSAQTFTVQIPISTRDEEAAVLPEAPVLEAAYPSPTAGRTTIAFVLPASERVRLEVFDVLGRRRAVLAEGPFAAGRHTATWDAGTSPTGLYFYRLTAGAAVRTRSLLRVR
ncbi:MAG: T9SS type A sorting domain-containing protein, partial [Rhodothermales bacterium]|nr:T9SS type A sorting domain-containing protein [Rhodothermales bacterium]